VKLWNIKEKRQEAFSPGHTGPVICTAVSSDGKHIVSGSYDRTMILWNIIEKRPKAVLQCHTSYINSIAITRDCKYIVSGFDDNTVRIWFLKRRENWLT
jgi:WD40 repeat protein